MRRLGEKIMTLKFKENKPDIALSHSISYKIAAIENIGYIPGKPAGLPDTIYGAIPVSHSTPPPLEVPGANLPRAVNYYADYGGCGWWRMIMPELMLNITQQAVINGLTTMIIDKPNFYQNVKAVRLQRQATPLQLEFVKYLKHFGQQHNYKIIYEIDDIIFKDDIPDFNRCKDAFVDPQIYASSMEMMKMCDEISVTCEYMKQYYVDKTGNKNITVIPNYPSRMWFDNHYSPDKILENYGKFKKQPRVGYVGSGTHFDVMNRTNQKDDFAHVITNIIASRKDFKWVFVGGYPLQCKPYIDAGEMEFIQWFPLADLWKAYTVTNLNAVYAPLMDCTFNRAKSNIKYLESACCGIPGSFQDIVTYKGAPVRFNNGNDLIDTIKYILKDETHYLSLSALARKYANQMFLDEHISEYKALYFTPFGSKERNEMSPSLIKNNSCQLIEKTHQV